tara:strand:+ start:1018 stop:1524 length:507 start_codon:yes stop_codon:yes gene_type:complete
MKASEVINRLKDVLLSSTETQEVVKTTTKEDVELKEQAPKVQDKSNPTDDIREISYSSDEVKSEKLAEGIDEDVDVDVDIDEKERTTEYATKEELSEVRAMVEKLRAIVESKEEAYADVPQELSSEEPIEPLSHSPENEVSEKLGVRISPNQRANTTYGRVLNAISNN